MSFRVAGNALAEVNAKFLVRVLPENHLFVFDITL